jgi:hypothetical protein
LRDRRPAIAAGAQRALRLDGDHVLTGGARQSVGRRGVTAMVPKFSDSSLTLCRIVVSPVRLGNKPCRASHRRVIPEVVRGSPCDALETTRTANERAKLAERVGFGLCQVLWIL